MQCTGAAHAPTALHRAPWARQRVAPRASSAPAQDTAGGDLIEFTPRYWEPVEAPPNAAPIVILPGFGNDTADYCLPFGDAQSPSCLVSALQRRGFRPYVVQMRRKEWFKVSRALLSSGYYNSRLTTDPGYTWYLERVREAVDLARRETGSDTVHMVGHSAGGWLARAFIGAERFKAKGSGGGSSDFEPHPAVRSLVTLGTPNTPAPGALDVSGGALTWTDFMWPGAFFAHAGVQYVAVAGRSVRGNAGAERKTPGAYAAASYQQVCGEGHLVEGDAVVPLRAALLAGAHHIVLDGVFHSMSQLGTFKTPTERPWYGSEVVVDSWLRELA